MNKSFLVMVSLLLSMSLVISFVSAYDANNPYTVTMNFIIGQDTSFTVSLAGSETTIDFNPSTMNSKNVEPDSQNAAGEVPIVKITNTGNVNLDFKHKVNTALPSWVSVCWNKANTVNWNNLLGSDLTIIDEDISPNSEVKVYMWANFTNALAGNYDRTYQISSSIAT